MTERECIIGSVAYIAGLIFGYMCGKGRKDGDHHARSI